MEVQAYVTFGGRCEEALEFYKKSIGAEVTGLMRWRDSPDAAMKAPPGYEEKIMNAAFRSYGVHGHAPTLDSYCSARDDD